ncbi:hypothetical protein QQS21_001933 [Conoideocrella luteorostrata]|uniref:Short-chain dehydrogenase n=1 Tax=Conoideocrella luteorostrata TaxID=1105319 RepID=A0AAJ0CW54_9HYPO|nr:hypothetical protein QQS21_001933 [Conoideocrella luteorostrata]
MASAKKGTIVLTGANGGLGAAVMDRMATRPELSNFHAVCTVRDTSSATTLRSKIDTLSHDLLSMDTSRLDQVRDVAKTINRRVAAGEMPPIRALILNAGFCEFEEQTWTEDGFDTSFAATYLGHWLLALLLLQSMDRQVGRIVVTASSAHDTADPRNDAGAQYVEEKWKTIFHDSAEPIARGTWSTPEEDSSYKGGYRRYGAAKLCQAMMIPELQRRLNADEALHNISILGVDPGNVGTGITRRGAIAIRAFANVMAWLAVIFTWLWPNGTFRTAKKSSGDILAAALDSNPVLGERPKEMYLNGEIPIEMSVEARDPKKRAILWAATIQYTGLRGDETALVNWS